MFSEIVEVRRLHPSEVNNGAVNDINILLKKQYLTVEPIEKKHLMDHLKHSVIVVGWNDGRLVAMGSLVRTSCLSHEFASIHNLIVMNGYDVLTIGMRIVGLLIENMQDVEFIEAGVWLQNDDLEQILKALGFVEKSSFRHRLRLKHNVHIGH